MMKERKVQRSKDERQKPHELLQAEQGRPTSKEELEERILQATSPTWLQFARAKQIQDEGTTHFTEPWLRCLRSAWVRDHTRHLFLDKDRPQYYFPDYSFVRSKSTGSVYKSQIIREVRKSILDLRIFLSLCISKTEEEHLIQDLGYTSKGILRYPKGNEGRKDRLGAVFDEKAFREAFTSPNDAITEIVGAISRLGGEGLAVAIIHAAAAPWGFEYRLVKPVESGF